MLKKIYFVLFLMFGHHMLHGQYNAEIIPLTKGVYIHQTFSDIPGYEKFAANGLIVEGDTSVWIVETGWDTAQTRQIIGWVRANLNKPIFGCIITHAHNDRLAGIPVLEKEQIPAISSEYVAAKAVERKLPVPVVGFDRVALIQESGIDIFVYYPGPGHTEENLIVLLQDKNVLFGGCFVKNCEATDLGNLEDADLEGWQRSLSTVKLMMDTNWPKIEWIIPGHGGWMCLDAVDHTLFLLSEEKD
jgi:metallo-beta-lactamase class B